MPATRIANPTIISEMESGRHTCRKLQRGAKGEVRFIKWVTHAKKQVRHGPRKNLRQETISEGGSLSDYCAIYECAGIKTERGTELSIVLIQS